MSNLMMWNLLVAFVLPHLIAVLQQPGWNNRIRVAVTVVICIIAGGITAWLNGDVTDWQDLVGSILTVLVGAVTFYKNLWVQTGIPQAIEGATSRSNPS